MKGDYDFVYDLNVQRDGKFFSLCFISLKINNEKEP